MFSVRPIGGRPLRRPTVTSSPWLAAALLTLPLGGFAAAQGYPQQPYPDQGYAQQGYPAQPGQDSSLDTRQDPPSRVARLSVAQGNISVQPASVQDFSPAEVNYPLTTGDRVWADAGALAELQIGQAAVRLGQQTDFTVTGLTDTLAQFGLAQGSLHLRTYEIDPNTTTELDTPNVAVTVLAPGDLRVDVYPGNNVTVVTLLSGSAEVNGDGISQLLRPGQSLQIAGVNPSSAQNARRLRPDGLDSFSAGQDSSYDSALAGENSYVSGETIGAQDLGNYGDWNSDADYGPVWFPRGVSVGWQPYRFGHWAYVGPWGWTWVASEPWGFAPFHYGRWGQFGGRWGWIPGPRVIRPVYSPALVAFVGGSGGGVTAWFPLGPREPYQPWYRTSDPYLTRVNVSNIYSRNPRDAQAAWARRGPSPFRPDPNRQYVNRGIATVAVPQNVFASGRPVPGAALRVDSRQFGNAPILQRPEGAPARGIMSSGPARALPPRMPRPVLQGGNPSSGRQPGGDFRGNRPPNGPGGQQGGQPGYGPGTQQGPIRRGPVEQAPGQAQQPNPGDQNRPQRGGQNGQGGQGGGNGDGQIRNGLMPPPTQPIRPQPQTPAGQMPPAQQVPGQTTPGQRPGSANPAPVVTQPGNPGGNPGYHRPVGPERGQFQQVPQQAPTQQPPAPQAPGQTAPGPRPGNVPTTVTQPGNPGYHGPVGPERGQFQPAPAQPPAQAPTASPSRPPVSQPQPSQPQPGFDRQRQGNNDTGRGSAPQPTNTVPQNRPAPPQQPQFIPRPATQPPPQPQAAPRPQPQPQAAPQPAPQPQAQPQPRPGPPQAEHKPQ